MSDRFRQFYGGAGVRGASLAHWMLALVVVLILLFAGLYTITNAQPVNCRKYTLRPLVRKISSRKVTLSQRAWNQTSVLQEFDYSDCRGQVKRVSYSYKKQRYVTLTTFDDDCDGGNVHGILKTAQGRIIAHIYDGDFYCPKDWR
jgi:hypothetical protein